MLVAAPAALAENGVGLAGPTTDKTVTFFCFGVIAFFAILRDRLSLIQGRLRERRKEQTPSHDLAAPTAALASVRSRKPLSRRFSVSPSILRDHLDLALERGVRGSSSPAGRRPGRCRPSCSARSRSAPGAPPRPRSGPRRSPRRRSSGCPPGPASTGSRVRPWAMSSASATRTTPASTV